MDGGKTGGVLQRHGARVEEVNADCKDEQCDGSRDYQLFIEDRQSTEVTETLTSALCAVRSVKCDTKLTTFLPGLEAYSLMYDTPCRFCRPLILLRRSDAKSESLQDVFLPAAYRYSIPNSTTQISGWMLLRSCCRWSESIGNTSTHMRKFERPRRQFFQDVRFQFFVKWEECGC